MRRSKSNNHFVPVSAIVPAAGHGKRMRSKESKTLMALNCEPLFLWTLRALIEAYPFRRIIVPTKSKDMKAMRLQVLKAGIKDVVFVVGGRTRAESVEKGLRRIKDNRGLVLVHDMARPLVGRDEVKSVIKAAEASGASILALKSTATVKEAHKASRKIKRTLDRENIYLAQTPQVFRTSILKKAYKKQGKMRFSFTDESGLVEALGHDVAIVPGSSRNIKITTPEDLRIARAIMDGDGNL